MEMLKTGQFYGSTSQKLDLDGVVITDTDYLHPYVDWHYHENAYFTFILKGNVLEGNRKGVFHCAAGDLVYHNWQESHYNIKPENCFTRGFHIELKPEWFTRYDLPSSIIEGSVRFDDPELKLIMYRLVSVSKEKNISDVAIDAELVRFYSTASSKTTLLESSVKPIWAKRLEELLSEPESHVLSLNAIAKAVDIHPVHLSRTFPKYFRHSFSQYLQLKKIEHSIKMIIENKNSLAAIAAESEFSDQSHFIRAFKKQQGLTPYAFKKLLALKM